MEDYDGYPLDDWSDLPTFKRLELVRTRVEDLTRPGDYQYWTVAHEAIAHASTDSSDLIRRLAEYHRDASRLPEYTPTGRTTPWAAADPNEVLLITDAIAGGRSGGALLMVSHDIKHVEPWTLAWTDDKRVCRPIRPGSMSNFVIYSEPIVHQRASDDAPRMYVYGFFK